MRTPISDLEHKVAAFYAPKLLNSVKHGESAVCVWFPGSGKSAIIRNILRSKDILRDCLGGLSPRLKISLINCDLLDDRTAAEVIKQLPANITRIVDLGFEVVIVLDAPDLLGENEFHHLLIYLARLLAINPHRVHILLNIVDKPLLEKLVFVSPGVATLLCETVYMPIVSGKLLEETFTYYEDIFQAKLSLRQHWTAVKTFGGVLKLSREYFRSRGSPGEVAFKLQALWQRVPLPYREILLKQARKERIRSEQEKRYLSELEKLGVVGLAIFKEKYWLLADNPRRDFEKTLTEKERLLFDFLTKSRGRVVGRDEAAKVIWVGQTSGYSDWAIDQFVSRFRKKLTQAGFGDESLQTIKGRGYKWIA